MKFELTNMRQQITDEDLLNDLRVVANNLGKHSLKQRDYSKVNGAQFNLKTAIDRFGNWGATLEKAGLQGEKSIKGMEYGEKEIHADILLDDLKRVASELDKSNISAIEYDALGKYTSTTMNVRFGSWNKAKAKANLLVTRTINNTNEELFQNILELWTLIGRQPKYGEVISPNSKFNGSTYARRFGSWSAALEAFIEYVNTESESNVNTEITPVLIPLDIPNDSKIASLKVLKIKKTSRNINLRMRWIILKGDNFCCRKCGRSPAKDPSIVLHIDHVLPWSRGGETVLENLETLCARCNLGKSNL
jgi:5-methylcytosine-specific restriction endonuclease McrA